MFSKLFAACLIGVQATSVAASISPGVYRITNVASQSTVRSYTPGGPLFVASTREFPGPFELFDIQTAPGTGGYTIRNVGLGAYVSAEGGALVANYNGIKETFAVEQAGDGQFVIKAVNADLLWTVLPPVIPRGDVVLKPSNGQGTQRFIITPVQSVDAASMRPGTYRIENVASRSLVRSYSQETPLFVSNTLEYPGPFALFDIEPAPSTGGYTIKSVGLNKYVSASAEAAGSPLFANGIEQAFSVEKAGDGQFVIKAVNEDLLWTAVPPFFPTSTVVLEPANGEDTQRFIITHADDIVPQTAPPSAKFRPQEPVGEDSEQHGWSFGGPVEVMLQYLAYGAH